jgi:hypothetical protein
MPLFTLRMEGLTLYWECLSRPVIVIGGIQLVATTSFS